MDRLQFEKDAVLAVIDSAATTLGWDDYGEFLDWLATEAGCRDAALAEEMDHCPDDDDGDD